MGGVDLPEWRPLRRNAEPHVPLLPHRRRLVVWAQRGERQRAERRTIARQRDLADRQLAFQRQQEGDLLAAPPTLAQPHPRSRQALDLILAHRTVLEQRTEPARAHLRGAPVEVARRLDFDDLAPADLLALTGMDIPAAGADERPQPRGLIGMDVTRRLLRLRRAIAFVLGPAFMIVMAGLDPAIHVLPCGQERRGCPNQVRA